MQNNSEAEDDPYFGCGISVKDGFSIKSPLYIKSLSSS